jgi:urate oxidase
VSVVLTSHQYGKAETHVVRIVRDTARHEIRDVVVTTALRGDFDAAYTDGDQSKVLPTDTQKNTVFSFAKEKGIDQIEPYALALARHFVDDVPPVTSATVEVTEHLWDRVVVDGAEHDHTWVRRGPEVRTAVVTVDGSAAAQRIEVTSGLRDLVLLKSTGSEFRGFLRDGYTTLEETDDRVMATSLVASWRHDGTDVDWGCSHASVRELLVGTYARVHSRALQQTLWEMGRAVLEAHPTIASVRLAAPNKHHFLVDLSPFGVENAGEVFYAADRPYGLIEATIGRD